MARCKARYEVVAQQVIKFHMTVNALSSGEAMKIARQQPDNHWIEDLETFQFDVIDAYEIEDEDG